MKLLKRAISHLPLKPPTLRTRAAGVLLHPTSLPGPFGGGDCGPEAYRFADTLAAAGLRWWQMLPITPPGPAPEFSPYSSQSAFAGSPWLVSPMMLCRQGLLTGRDLAAAGPATNGRIDFPRLRQVRGDLLRKAYANINHLSRPDRQELIYFHSENNVWLDDYALFAALKDRYGQRPWTQWPQPLRLRNDAALAEARQKLAESIAFHRFVQWLFDRQWAALKRYCNQHGIGLIGDIPIFVSHDSADVWTHRELFLLDSTGRPTVVSGYPADPFSPRGQRWGHPHYRWAAHQSSGFAWWMARFERTLRQFNAVRIDHFLGFHHVWAVPAKSKNGIHGRWLKAPGAALFAALGKRHPRAPIIAEDLGKPTPRAIELRDKHGFPGMRVLQFAFGGDDHHLPDTYVPHCVAYTGTHDNQTIIGWLEDQKISGNGTLARAMACVGGNGSQPHWDFIRALSASVANTVIVPMQDVLGLGAEHRMNIPGVLKGNWGWRMTGHLPAGVISRLRAIGQAAGRVAPKNGRS
jgi:4-alpha-glucanotransferase